MKEQPTVKKQPGRPSLPCLVTVLALFAVPAALCWAPLVLGQRDVSLVENRTLAQFPALTLEGFLSGTLQDQL